MFFGKPRVEKLEKEFETDKLKNKYLFYDLNFRAGDPEEVRSYSAELLQEMEFFPVINKLVKFEDSEIEGLFSAGRLKPVKGVIKGIKKVKKGPKFPILWKLFAILGFAMLMLYLYPDFNSNQQLLWFSVIFLSIAFVIYLFKRVLVMETWVKLVGVYDIESEESDMRIIIAADSKDKTKDSFKILESDINNFYQEIAARYVKPKPKKEKKILVFKRGVSPEEKLSSALSSIDEEIANLDSRLSRGEITEETYKEVKARLLKRRDKILTLSDLLNITK